MKYIIGDKVQTDYGIGKIVKKQRVRDTYCYLIRYKLFTKLWCFESSIKKRFSRWI